MPTSRQVSTSLNNLLSWAVHIVTLFQREPFHLPNDVGKLVGLAPVVGVDGRVLAANLLAGVRGLDDDLGLARTSRHGDNVAKDSGGDFIKKSFL